MPRPRARKRQSKLNFSPAPKTGQSVTRLAKPTRSKSKAAVAYSSSDDELQAETERGLRLGVADAHSPHGMFDGSDVGGATSESEDEEVVQGPVKSKSTKRKRRAKDNQDLDEEDDGAEILEILGQRRRGREKRVEIQDLNEELKLPTKRRKTKQLSNPKEPPTPPRSARRRAVRQPSSTEDEEEEAVQTPPRHTRRKAIRRRSPSVEDESPPRKSRRRTTRAEPTPDEEELDEVDTVIGSNDAEDDNEERDELREDLHFLTSSPPPDRGRLRSTQGKPKNERQKALEALKARRASTQEPSSSTTPRCRRTIVVESDSETASELEVIEEESEVEDPEESDDEGPDREANALDLFKEDDEDANFIDDDDEALIGHPSVTDDLEELRLENALKRAKTKDLFKHAVEWMVMKKIHPAFNSNRNIYTITFRKLDDEVKGLAESKFTSSVWTPDFTRTIQARPNIDISELSGATRDFLAAHCQACNRKKHIATFELQFSGPPYDPRTLEPLESNDSDSDSSSDISSAGPKHEYDVTGAKLPPVDHRFFLGSTCKANAQVAHTLNHWRYNLYDWVKDHLAREGHLTAEKLVKRDGRSDRKRDKEARKIVDAMEESGEVRRLYRLYSEQVKFAVEVRNEYKNGWGRRG